MLGKMPPKLKDLLGNKIGKLTVLKLSDHRKNSCYYWDCICECGNLTTVKATSLNRNITRSCGCLKKTHFYNLTGLKFNKITLLTYLGTNKYLCHIYDAICDCGKKMTTEGNDIKSGKIKSCGCGKILAAKARSNPKKAAENQLYGNTKRRAENKKPDGIPFTLTFEEYVTKINMICHVCKRLPSNLYKSRRMTIAYPYNGLDRLDNLQGYTPENTVPMCFICNQAKHTMTVEAFKAWFDAVYSAKKERYGFWK